MLNYSPQSFSASSARVVSGQFLAKNRLCKRDRAKLAADILARKVAVVDLTAKQLARLCRVCAPYIAEARGRTPVRRLLRDWNAASHEARVAFARAAGAERVFDIITEAVHGAARKGGASSLHERNNPMPFETEPIPPLPFLAHLREEVLRHSLKRTPKWKFRLASDLVFQLQPKPTVMLSEAATARGIKPRLQTEGVTGEALKQLPKWPCPPWWQSDSAPGASASCVTTRPAFSLNGRHGQKPKHARSWAS
jgi:hypothetical protein